MSIEGYKLISPVYSRNIVKFPAQRIKSLSIPNMCPNCLKAGDMIKRFQESYQSGNMKYTLQFGLSTHKNCSGGFMNSDISGSVKVKMDWGGNIRFWFREPLYALIFTSVNFPMLSGEDGRSLTQYYDEEVGRKVPSPKSSKHCPQCRAPLGDVTECPSCHYDFTKEGKKKTPDESSKASVEDWSIKCPKCAIMMIKNKKITECGNCGQEISQ